MPAPIIGITAGRSQNEKNTSVISLTEAYVIAVLRAGGIPVIIPTGLNQDHLETLVSHIHGLIITGGPDIDPARFNGESHPRIRGVDVDRDNMEVDLTHQAVDLGKPFMGICRGLQIVNVALGGSLYTDLQDQFPTHPKHDFYPDWPRDHIAHTVTVRPGSLLENIVRIPTLEVNSLHHQGIKILAPGLVSDATAPGDLIESIEVPNHPFGLAVQWHPEWMPTSLPMQALFRALVEASAK